MDYILWGEIMFERLKEDIGWIKYITHSIITEIKSIWIIWASGLQTWVFNLLVKQNTIVVKHTEKRKWKANHR